MALVYVIEDDETLRVELKRLLELNGHQVASCETFSAAAQDVLDTRPDCVLLDLKLPGTDGLSICRDIRTQDKSVPIIMITSSDSEFDEVMSMTLVPTITSPSLTDRRSSLSHLRADHRPAREVRNGQVAPVDDHQKRCRQHDRLQDVNAEPGEQTRLQHADGASRMAERKT